MIRHVTVVTVLTLVAALALPGPAGCKWVERFVPGSAPREGAPASAPASVPTARGEVVGRLTRDGAPLAGVRIEICDSPASSTSGRGTPCSAAPWRSQAVTEADGFFHLKDVAAGHPTLAFLVDGHWAVSTEPCCADLTAGETVDIGALDFGE